MKVKTIEDFSEQKKRLIKYLQETNDIINCFERIVGTFPKSDEMTKSPREIVTDLINKVEKDVFKILIVGEFSTGKSTFLNVVLGEEILPMAVRPTTATINLIKYSENKTAVIHFWGERDENGRELTEGKTEIIPFTELKNYTTSLTDEANEKSKKIKMVEIYYPSEYCKNGVEVLDTPGLNSTNGHHERATIEYLPNGNVGIMLFNANQFLTKSESEYLKTFKKYMDKMFFVANKVDLIDKEELQESIPFWESQLKDILNSKNDIKVYPVAAKNALNGNGKDSGFYDFKSAFEKFLTSDEKAIEIINPPINTVLSILANLKTNLQLQIDGMQFSSDEFEKKISENMPKLERIRKRKSELIEYVSNREQLLYNKLHYEISRYLDDYLNSIETEIINWNGEIKALEEALPQIIKENLVEVSHIIQAHISEEISEIFEETAARYKDFLADLGDFKTNFIKSDNLENQLVKVDELAGYSDSDITDLVIQFGGAFGIGWLSALLLSGPLGWIVAFGGSALFGGFISEKRRQKQLMKIATEVRIKLENELKNVLPETKSKMRETFNNFKDTTENQMITLLQSVENTIKSIKQNMKLEQNKIEQKRNEYLTIHKKIIKLEKLLLELRIEPN